MIDPSVFYTQLEKLQTAMSKKLRVRGATFDRQFRRAEHRLPRRQRRAATTILGAQDWMAHPKLARVLDFSTVNNAFADLQAYLDRIDPAEERKMAILRLLAGIVIKLMLLGGLVFALIHWQGLG